MKTIERTAHADARPRLRLFVAAHVGAVLAIYALAWYVGGGFAPSPFPPDVRPKASTSTSTRPLPPVRATAEAVDARASTSDLQARTSTDRPAPWRVDAEGRIQSRAD